jgi:transcriptional regulator with XRE-family HTH domain
MGHQELAEAVRNARTTRGISQRELGEASGVGPTTVRRVESGSETYEPSVRILCAVAFALELDPADLTRAYAATAEQDTPV